MKWLWNNKFTSCQRPPLLVLECAIDEGRHKTNGKQFEPVACPHGMLLFLIVRSDLKKTQKTLCVLRAFAVQKNMNLYNSTARYAQDAKHAKKDIVTQKTLCVLRALYVQS